ncbi:hypothetical protein HDU93_005261 [Gonapodya sp. JEL0774]|nr:hypothetical protein HDU93_005261 [Gonapodya sp. JEL0774]
MAPSLKATFSAAFARIPFLGPVIVKVPKSAAVEIRVVRVSQLFNSLDPSPFFLKDLVRAKKTPAFSRLGDFILAPMADHDAEDFILTYAQETPDASDFLIRIFLGPGTIAKADEYDHRNEDNGAEPDLDSESDVELAVWNETRLGSDGRQCLGWSGEDSTNANLDIDARERIAISPSSALSSNAAGDQAQQCVRVTTGAPANSPQQSHHIHFNSPTNLPTPSTLESKRNPRGRHSRCSSVLVLQEDRNTVFELERDVQAAITRHFEYQCRRKRIQLQTHLASLRISLLLGLIILLLALLLSRYLSSISSSDGVHDQTLLLSEWASQCLTVVGWVSVWRPAEMALYGWVPMWKEWRFLKVLARAKVELRFAGGTGEKLRNKQKAVDGVN